MFKYTKPKDNRYNIAIFANGKESKQEVEAYDIAYDILGIRKDRKHWVLDHIPTGRTVGVFCKTVALAQQAVRELFEVTDFKFITPPEEIREPVMEIIKRYR